MTTSTITPEIVRFAQAVRAALADLPREEVDDLTEGLEADLGEAFAEDLERELPDPAAYAEELRNAAGLPVRTDSAKRGIGHAFTAFAENLRETRRNAVESLRQSPFMAALLDLFAELRPAWWILRAWVAYLLIAGFWLGKQAVLPTDLGLWVVMLVLAAVSVQWGRGHWLPRSGLPWLIGAGNVLAVLVLLPAFAFVNSGSGGYDLGYNDGFSSALAPGDGHGITLNGKTVTNIFAYGADGNPLSHIQLFDQEGRPLVPQLDPSRDGCADIDCVADSKGRTWVPVPLATGVTALNVFPLSLIATTSESNGKVITDRDAEVEAPKPPLLKVPAVLSPPAATKKSVKNNQ